MENTMKKIKEILAQQFNIKASIAKKRWNARNPNDVVEPFIKLLSRSISCQILQIGQYVFITEAAIPVLESMGFSTLSTDKKRELDSTLTDDMKIICNVNYKLFFIIIPDGMWNDLILAINIGKRAAKLQYDNIAQVDWSVVIATLEELDMRSIP
jgi:hypothetical protein